MIDRSKIEGVARAMCAAHGDNPDARMAGGPNWERWRSEAINFLAAQEWAADQRKPPEESCPKCGSGYWPSVNFKNGKPYSYCPECGWDDRRS